MEEKIMLDVWYENFPCKERLADGYEREVARALYGTCGVVPMETLEKICQTQKQVYTYISKLRAKLSEGHSIVKLDGGYQLRYPGESSCVDGQEAVRVTQSLLKQRVASLRSAIEEINTQLQRLNEDKQQLKRSLELAEVALLAIEEMEGIG
jgi:hypothetical protein